MNAFAVITAWQRDFCKPMHVADGKALITGVVVLLFGLAEVAWPMLFGRSLAKEASVRSSVLSGVSFIIGGAWIALLGLGINGRYYAVSSVVVSMGIAVWSRIADKKQARSPDEMRANTPTEQQTSTTVGSKPDPL